MTVQKIQLLDPRIKKGTYLLLTASGASYKVACSKRPSGRVEYEGGSLHLPLAVGCVGHEQSSGMFTEPTIQVGAAFSIIGGVTSSQIVAIYNITSATDEEVAELTRNHSKEQRQRSWEHNPPAFSF